MAADFGLVADAAERDAHILAVGRARDRFGNGAFADAGRADEADDLPIELGRELLDGHKFQNAVLDLAQTVVVLVENLRGLLNVQPVSGAPAPGQLKAGFDIIADHGRFGRTERHPRQLGVLLVQPFGHLGGQFRFFDPRIILVALLVARFVDVQLALDGLELLAEIDFALAALEVVADLGLNRAFQFDEVDLTAENAEQRLQPFFAVQNLNHLLPVLELDEERAAQTVGQQAGVVAQLADVADMYARDEVAVRVADLHPLGAVLSLDDKLIIAVGQPQRVLDFCGDADFIQVVRLRADDRRVALDGQKQLRPRFLRLLERLDRSLPRDFKAGDDVREEHDAAQRDGRQRFFGNFFYRYGHRVLQSPLRRYREKACAADGLHALA